MKVESLIVGPLEVCCYIVYCAETKEGVIIDPGDADPRIVDKVKKLGLKIVAILGTHAHADHVAGVEYLRKELKVPYMVHKLDDEFFRDPVNFSMFKSWGFPENPKADKVLEEGDIIEFGKENLRVIHTPGHSPGSSCFYNEKHKILFTGDTLFVEAVGRADLPGGNYFQMMDSIIKKLLVLPDDTKIYPGHDYGPKPVSTIGEEKKNNPFIQEFLQEF